ncbi:MAG TPA: ribose 5-phosphate isomerase A, partial [Ignavibacteria bacterium]|nr:ribose 5-phosphate isomerase A [Ignavibacteria bacterium]HMR41014.1 ribose 5-phosphate isomerase A [Ignavibacteria bacterium]
MIVGLGSGSTVFFTIKKLGELVSAGLNIKCVSTSSSTTRIAQESGIEIITLDSVNEIDLTIDGADEVDREFNGIKGGGGALLFEKIVALYSRKNIWIVDSEKLVHQLGKYPLPVEVIPFGHKRVFEIMRGSDLNPVIRKKADEIYYTDSG